MFRADSILFMLAGVLGLWGLSLLARGLLGDRAGRRRCPACEKDVAEGTNRCAACGFESTRGLDFRATRRHWGAVVSGSVLALLAAGAFLAGVGIQRWAYTGGDYVAIREAAPWDMLALGIVFFGAAVVVRGLYGRSSRGKRHCPRCWYDMEGAPALVCPECGHDSREVRNLYRRQRRARLAWTGAVVVLVGSAGFAVPAVKRGGWLALVPTWVLIAGLERLPDQFFNARGQWSGASLYERYFAMKPDDRERRWLKNKCLDILRTSDDPALIQRVLQIVWNEPESGYAILPRLAADIESPDEERRGNAARGLASVVLLWKQYRVPEDSPAPLRGHYQALLKATGDESTTVASTAAALLAYCDEDPGRTAQSLLALVAEGAPLTRSTSAAVALAELVRRHEGADAVVAAALDGTDPRLRLAAFLAVCVRPYAEVLDEFLGDPVPAAGAHEPRKVVSAVLELRQGLESEFDPSGWETPLPPGILGSARRATPLVLRDILGPRIDALARGLDLEEAQLRIDSILLLEWASGLCEFDRPAVVAALRARLNDPDQTVREIAERAISIVQPGEH